MSSVLTVDAGAAAVDGAALGLESWAVAELVSARLEPERTISNARTYESRRSWPLRPRVAALVEGLFTGFPFRFGSRGDVPGDYVVVSKLRAADHHYIPLPLRHSLPRNTEPLNKHPILLKSDHGTRSYVGVAAPRTSGVANLRYAACMTTAAGRDLRLSV